MAAALWLAILPVPAHTGAADYSARALSDGQFQYLLASANAVWANGTFAWHYNPSGQPAHLTADQVVEEIQNSARKWENVCNLRFSYLGTTTADPNPDATYRTVDRVPVVGWAPLAGNRSRFLMYTSSWYVYGSDGAEMIDADVIINTTADPAYASLSLSELGALFTHEFGHVLGVAHSDDPNSVMYSDPYNSFHFQSTLRADDAAACASLYGYHSQADANRVFNWAEQVHPDLFAPAGVASVEGQGFQYRYYPGTGSYLGAQDGQVYYLKRGEVLLDVGSVSDFKASAIDAGF